MLRLVFSVYVFIIAKVVVLIYNVDGRAVDFRDLSSNSTARTKAEEHFKQIEKKVCTTPVAKLFPVNEYHSMTDGFYKPHCVELHRCNNDAGCCKYEDMVCGPVDTETVYLHISVTRLSGTKVFLMPFQNHTRCECQPEIEVMPECSCSQEIF